MLSPELVYHASVTVTVGLLLALFVIWLRRDLGQSMAVMSGTMIVGLIGLVVLQRIESMLVTGTMANVVREAMLLLIAVGFIRIAIVFLFQGVLKRLNVPRILADALIVVVLIVFALYRMNAVGVNLASIITTSAIVSGGIALSLREPLENLWGGIALQLDNTCRIGDWIRMDGVSGQIVGIRWRYLSLATNTNETVIIPNSQLTKNRVTVLARRGDDRVPQRRDVEFSVSYDVPPARVIAVVEEALARSEIRNVAANPPILVVCTGFGDNAIHFVVRYGLTNLSADVWTDSQVRLHVAATLARNGMEMPLPQRVLIRGRRLGAPEVHERELTARSAALSKLELFAALTDVERRALSEELSDWPYVADDIISRQGEPADSMFILAQGRVGVFDDSASGTGARDRLATLKAPNLFGEMGLLTGQARGATVVAETEVLCYRLDKAGFDTILKARPELVEQLSRVVAARQMANDATLQGLGAEVRARNASTRAADLVRRIKSFFAIES
jgi:small-conductance mechanosensitive channel